MAIEGRTIAGEEASANGLTGDRSARWAPVLAVAVLAAVASAVVFAVRLHSIIAYGALYPMTGGEGPILYSIWKAQNGYPVYEPIGPNNPSGSFYNGLFYLLEMETGAIILASVLIVREMRRPVVLARPGRFAGLAIMPAAQLVLWNRIGKISLATAAEYQSKRALAAEVVALPRPLFARDELLALPWYSSGGRYPAIVLDLVVRNVPLLTRQIENHHFRSLVLPEGDVFEAPALRVGYVHEPVRPGAASRTERVLLRVD